MRRTPVIVAAVPAVLLVSPLLVAPAIVERVSNQVLNAPPYTVRAEAERLYRDLFVVDLHGDSVPWDRDLNERLSHGSIDVPHLVEDNVAIQCFFIVTRAP